MPIPKPELSAGTALEVDMAQVRGQHQTKRALEIAATGGHNLLMCGSPGSGKTLMAKALRGILPTLSFEEQLEVTKIHSVAGLLPAEKPLIAERPFRILHHTASAMSVVGGGNIPGPGEISLAHRGVLFMDELAEFPRAVLEALRQPMEDRKITVSRVRGSSTYPSQFLLVGAMNPCPCGYRYAEDERHPCGCSPIELKRYEKRLSGPLLDRMDLFVNVRPVQINDLGKDYSAESSAEIQQRVERATEIQRKRFKNQSVRCNAEMGNREVMHCCALEPEARELLESAVERVGFSARGYFRILKVSRTIADLGGRETISPSDIAEALQFRLKTDV